MNKDLNQSIYSKSVIELVTVANQYCTFIEEAGTMPTIQMLGVAQKLLPLLYLKACLIPAVEEKDDESFVESFVTEVDYVYLQTRIRNKLGEHDDYKEVFKEGIEFSEEALVESISESLMDIYQDLKNFIMNYRTADDTAMLESLWECMEHFKMYWGQRLVNVQRAIHALVYSDIDFEQEEKTFNTDKGDKEMPSWLEGRYDG